MEEEVVARRAPDDVYNAGLQVLVGPLMPAAEAGYTVECRVPLHVDLGGRIPWWVSKKVTDEVCGSLIGESGRVIAAQTRMPSKF